MMSGIDGRRTGTAETGIASAKLFFTLAAVMLLVSVAERFVFEMQTDTSSFISVWENVLDGMVYGVDVLEVNPPTAGAIYLPGIFLGRFTGLSPETGIYITFYALCFLSMALMFRCDRAAKLMQPDERFWFYLTFLFVILVYYQVYFTQRERCAVLLMLPYLMLEAGYPGAENGGTRAVSKPERALIGLMMGIGTALKPHFLLVMVFFSAYGLFRTRSLRCFLRLETLVFFVSYIAYFGLMGLVFPEYYVFAADFLVKAYVGTMLPFWHVVSAPHSMLYLLVLSGCVAAIRRLGLFHRPLIMLLLIGSVAFYIVYLFQRKSFSNHIHPAQVFLFLCVVLVYLQLVAALKQAGCSAKDMLIYKCIAAGLSVVVLTDGAQETYFIDSRVHLESAVRAVKEKPTLLQITHSIFDSHPMIRNIGGRYVGSFMHMFGFTHIDNADIPLILKDSFEDLPPEKRAYFERERENSLYQLRIAAKDIRERKPDIILTHGGGIWQQFVMAQPDMKQALSDYEYVRTVNKVEIWRRKE
jgi:hypothetical protein